MTVKVRAMTYNLENRGKGPRDREDAQDAWMMGLGYDVLLLQEFWDTTGTHRAAVKRLADKLEMDWECVEAPRSHCHMGMLWRPGKMKLLNFEPLLWNLWHGAGFGDFEVRDDDHPGGGHALRVAVGHAAPVSAEHRFLEVSAFAKILFTPKVPAILGIDRNCIRVGDPEPDVSDWDPNERVRRELWTTDRQGRRVFDRRPMKFLKAAGIRDAADVLGQEWRPTADFERGGLNVDGILVNPAAAPLVESCEVHDGEVQRKWSDHVGVAVTLRFGSA